jgi:molybdopterin/thiamine biosynthesis adenylyltransferase
VGIVLDFGDIVDLRRVQDARLCIAGCGAVGCNMVLAALQTGFRSFALIDHDIVGPHNTARSAGLFHPARDIGKAKARLLAEHIRDWDPACSAAAFELDVRDLGRNFFTRFNAVMIALDNMESTWHIGETLAATGVPAYRAATNGWNSSVEIVENLPGGACLCCNHEPAQARDLRVASCGTRYLSDIEKGRVPALQLSSALCANRAVGELVRRMTHQAEKRENLRYYDTGRELHAFKLAKNSECACQWGVAEPPANAMPGNVYSTTLEGLLGALEARLGEGVCVSVGDDFVLEGVCGSCGARYPVRKPLRHVRESEMHCPRCPMQSRAPDSAEVLQEFSRESPVLSLTLAELGFRACGNFAAAVPSGEMSLWRMTGDWAALRARAYLIEERVELLE